MPLSEHLPQNTCCVHTLEETLSPLLCRCQLRQAVRLISLPELDFGCGQLFLPVLSWGFPVLSCREGNERHGESPEAEGSNTAPCLQHYLHFPPLCIPNPLLSNYFSSPLCIFASCPFSSLCSPCLLPRHRLLSGIPLPC